MMKKKSSFILTADDYTVTIEDDLCICDYNMEVLSLEIATAVVEFRTEKVPGKKIFIMSDIRKVKSVPKEARDYFAKGKAVENVMATAFVSNSVTTRLIFNFFMNHNKPPVPVKLFGKREDAIKWLQSEGMQNGIAA